MAEVAWSGTDSSDGQGLRRRRPSLRAEHPVAHRDAGQAGQGAARRLVGSPTTNAVDAERLLRSVIEALDGALCIVGQDGSILDANRSWPAPVGSDFFGWCQDTPDLHHLLTEVADYVRVLLDVGSPGRVGTVPPLGAVATEKTGACAEGGGEGVRTPPNGPMAIKGRIGPPNDQRWVVIRVHPVRDHHLARAVVTLTDITVGMQAQEELHRAKSDAEQLATALTQEKAVLTGVISAIPQLVYWKNDGSRFGGCNRAYLTMAGLDEETEPLGADAPAHARWGAPTATRDRPLLAALDGLERRSA